MSQGSVLLRRLAVYAAVWQTRLREYLVAPVDGELALHEGRLEEIVEIARVHLARVVGELGGEVDGPHHPHPAVLDHLAGSRELAVAALLGGDVDHHGARAHALDHRARDDSRRR